ncbi:hypothetical protein [Paraburkholderia saeva]|uniref:DUF2489 domain-containing protein n=1 Tax=Paraburkholderia saeva TaxID=2777537 RepID=A0A9N8WZ83_9BURK|nr:hypothetical protein [Paraburkholderia saeva]CAG4887532.1 hypothetical protein LMG31841_00459 [Paraburkholderia saeva]
MSEEIAVPEGIKNKALWRKHCRKIHARAKDLVEGRLGIIEAARVICLLAIWTRVENEPVFQVFGAIDRETCYLPVGAVRAHWTPEALTREDVVIHASEIRWRNQAIAAAATLVEQYKWAGR